MKENVLNIALSRNSISLDIQIQELEQIHLLSKIPDLVGQDMILQDYTLFLHETALSLKLKNMDLLDRIIFSITLDLTGQNKVVNDPR